MHVRSLFAVFILTLFTAPGYAGLVENHFEGKGEAAVAAEFEAGLGAFLSARLKDPAIVVRMFAPVAKNTEVFVQLKSVDGANSVWITLVNGGWFKATEKTQCAYAFEPFGKEYNVELATLPPAEVATWFSPKTRTPAEIVGCACWLAAKGQLLLANAEVAALATAKDALKKDVEEWLALKNGWTLPSGGLESVPTFNMKHSEEGVLLLTPEAKTAWFKQLDTEGKEAFKELEKLQGNDVKSKPGYRKNSPGMRLELLQNVVVNFAKAYAGTAFMEKKGAKDLEKIAEAIAADLKWIEDEKYKAERKGIDLDWAGAAKHYELLQRADPLNPELTQATAAAFYTAAKVTDGGRKAEDPASAKRAAQYYEELIAIYPSQLGYRNHAGLNWLASGDSSKAKVHHQEVVRRTDDRNDLSENDKGNREFALKQLGLIK